MQDDRDRQKALVFLAMATQLGTLSTCDRKSVGAIIVKDGRCISWGFNGAPRGMPHCDANNHGFLGHEGYWGMSAAEALWQFGCQNVVHAEANAIAFAARQGISTDKCTLYVSLAPCDVCAKLLVSAGIESVHYSEAYRDTTGVSMLGRAGVRVVGYNEGV